MRISTRIICFGLFALTACADFPDLNIVGNGVQNGVEFPALVPIDPLLLTAASDAESIEEQAQLLTTRVRLLRARARAMQRPVIDRRTRRKLAAALRRHVR